MADSKFSFDSNNFAFTGKEKSYATGEIGDVKSPGEFFPQVKVMRWGNEINCSARLIHEETEPKLSEVGDRIVWAGKDIVANFYEVGGGKVGGGLEFDIHLLKAPKTNVLSFSLQTKGLNFFPQPPLSSEEIKEGLERPDDVVGSIVAYHQTRSGDYSAFAPLYKPEMQIEYPCIHDYKAGKAFKFPRPQLVDANGRTCWGDLKIDVKAGLLNVIIPWDYLYSAAYPIRHAAGLLFGYDHVGGSIDIYAYAYNIVTKAVVGDSAPATPAFNGVLYSLIGYFNKLENSPVFCPALYSNSGTAPNARLAYIDSGGTLIGAAAWVETLLPYSPVVAGTQYWLGAADPTLGGRYSMFLDGGAPAGSAYKVTPPIAWPATISGWTSSTRINSIYAKYVLSGAAGPLVNGVPLKSLLRGLVT